MRSQQRTLTPAERLLSPFLEFLHQETSGGILLLICTVVALVWANVPSIADSYFALWQSQLVIGFGGAILAKPVVLWINDGLMAIFFFLVGLEIKREIISGELSSPRQAALPAAAALGGMVIPALIYGALNFGGPNAAGWAVPMATDIAFSLGVLALLGKRVPLSLKVFLTAFAIVDDLGAVAIIAGVYTSDIVWPSLLAAAVILLVLIVANRLGVRKPLVYAVLGVCLWFAVLKSGVHATIAGVALAMTIPATARIPRKEFTDEGRSLIEAIENAGAGQEGSKIVQHGALQALETNIHNAQSPLQRLEHALHPWVAFLVMPVFALANAGVALGSQMGSALSSPVTLGIAAGLVFGKQVGITLFSWIAVRTGLASSLPAGVSWKHIYGIAWLGGIGFTMSLFIADLAFGTGPALQAAKVGILGGSLISGIVGWLVLIRVTSFRQE